MAHGTNCGRAPSRAAIEHSEASALSGRFAGGRSEAGSGRWQGAAREVIVTMPSREDLGTVHLDPPLARVTSAAWQPDPAWQQRPAPANGRQRHLCATWDLAVEAQRVQAVLRISFPCPLMIPGGSNLPAGQELVGKFAYRLGRERWRVLRGVARIGTEGTVTTAGIIGLSVVTGWEKRRPECVDVAWLARRVHVGRQQKGGINVIDVRGGEAAPPPCHPRPEAESLAPLPFPRGHRCAPPPSPRPRVRAPPRSGRPVSGRGGLWMSWWTSSSNSSSSTARQGRSARSARRLRSATSRPACLRPTKTGGLLRRSWLPCAATRITRNQVENIGAGLSDGTQDHRGQATGTDRGG